MTKKKSTKLNEEPTTTLGYPSFGGVVGDDDHPPGNIVFGHKYNRAMVPNRLTGAFPNFFVDGEDDWKWDVFTGVKGMQDKENYSDTLDSFDKDNSPIKRDDFNIWKHVKSKEKDHSWADDKEKLREPEQQHQIGDDEPDVPDNPKTGEDEDNAIKLANKHLKKGE